MDAGQLREMTWHLMGTWMRILLIFRVVFNTHLFTLVSATVIDPSIGLLCRCMLASVKPGSGRRHEGIWSLGVIGLGADRRSTSQRHRPSAENDSIQRPPGSRRHW